MWNKDRKYCWLIVFKVIKLITCAIDLSSRNCRIVHNGSWVPSFIGLTRKIGDRRKHCGRAKISCPLRFFILE
jgi:hypothetical protein